jgi:hypothetical protein
MSHTYELLQCTQRHTIIMQYISNEYGTLNLFAYNYTDHISRETTPQRHPATPHSYTHTHLHHHEVPVLGCHVKAASAVVVREEEQVAAALLDEQLW